MLTHEISPWTLPWDLPSFISCEWQDFWHEFLSSGKSRSYFTVVKLGGLTKTSSYHNICLWDIRGYKFKSIMYVERFALVLQLHMKPQSQFSRASASPSVSLHVRRSSCVEMTGISQRYVTFGSLFSPSRSLFHPSGRTPQSFRSTSTHSCYQKRHSPSNTFVQFLPLIVVLENVLSQQWDFWRPCTSIARNQLS